MFHVEIDIASKTPKQEEDEPDYYPHDEADENIRKHRSNTPDNQPSSQTEQEHNVKEIANMRMSEALVVESIEVREFLRFLFNLVILNKLVLLLQCKHSKYMYARCLNFPCFINYLAACIHAFCMLYLYVSLGTW